MKTSAPVVAFLVLALVAGCALQPAAGPGPGAVPPALELLELGDLQVPAGCEPAEARVYRTSFVVRADGRVSGVTPESGAGCVENALAKWVSTYRYAPVPQDVPAVVDWMAVTARRGG